MSTNESTSQQQPLAAATIAAAGTQGADVAADDRSGPSNGHQAPRRASARGDRRQQLLRHVITSDRWPSDAVRQRAAFFADSFARRADDELLRRHPPEAMPAHVENLFAFFADRAQDQVLVRCYVPTAESHGFAMATPILETCMADQPFIVDTIKLVLRRMRVRSAGTMNMILPVGRDDSGALRALTLDDATCRNESFTCHMLAPAEGATQLSDIERAVQEHLERAARVVGDFRAMRRLVRDVNSTLAFAAEAMPGRASALVEAAAFGEWLVDDHFVFLGAYGFDEQGRPTGRLGLGRYDAAGRAGVETDPAEAFGGDAPLVSILQSRLDAPIHRDARMQEVRFRLFDAAGEPDGGVVFQGLFTYAALTAPASNVPMLRQRLAHMVVAEDLVPRSHRMKLFHSFFDRLPLTYTFAADDGEIRALINEAIDVDFGGQARVHTLVGPSGTGAHVFVMVAADRFGDKLRWQVQEALRRAYGADHLEFRLLTGKTDAAMWHFLLHADGVLRGADIDALSENVLTIVSPWATRLREMLRAAGTSDARSEAWAVRFADSLAEDYRQRVRADHLAADLEDLAAVLDGGPPRLRLRRDAVDERDGTARLLYYTPTDSALTDILPIIDHFGLRVLGEVTMPVRDVSGRACFFETYRIALDADQGPNLMEHGDALLEALHAVLDGRMASTSLNRLLLAARLTWRQLQVLRLYIAYARQLGVAFPPNMVQQVLHDQAPVARTLIDLFDARFAPRPAGAADVVSARSEARQASVSAVEERFRAQLDAVSDASEDKILRMFYNLISATLRTNFFQRPAQARALSCKFRCSEVELMRDPRPMFEIFVYDPRVEGIHLRGGPVARGGLRWSDRLDDYRTEILGLMLTQMVKNTLIVPVGSKGGFVLKVTERDDMARRKLADELYKVFIHGLLDLTDNLVDGKPALPDDVVVWDDPDPYLVVAADKGTAHLSDTANGIALERGFWLGDAFASGGSQGYDHKKYGITARGGWVCVQRHFREMGIDTQRDPISCVGIGDMSGDVFGNGMLLTETLLLKGAFNHRHIFLDPDPNPAESFAERKRLFQLPRSGWGDYDVGKISKGGGVFDRGAKRIPLSHEVREMLGVDRDELAGEELVRLLLTMDVQLLWNGGIGTYVKASSQSHADAGDKTNDAVRVDARALRCRVVGEGGNLGFTQAARVEFALQGGRINTDAVDNSGGVDLSDHEVNLKILFAPLLQSGKLPVAARDDVLFAVDHAVCDLVLGDNAQQALGLSLAQARCQGAVRSYEPVIASLVDWLGIDRDLQDLPGVVKLQERANAGQSLTRPELARVAAFAKMWVYQELARDVTASAAVADELLEVYFPSKVWTEWRTAIDGHMLRHPIVCTVWCNEMVDYGGPRMVVSLMLEYGRPIRDVANAWMLASRLLRARKLRDQLALLDAKIPAAVQIEASLALETAVAAAARSILSTTRGDEFTDALRWTDDAEAFAAAAAEAVLEALPTARRAELRTKARTWTSMGVPQELAMALVRVQALTALPLVQRLAARSGLTAADALAVWHGAAGRSGLGDLLEGDDAVAMDRWSAAARASVHQDISESLLALACDIARHLGGQVQRPAAIERAVDRDAELSQIWSFARQIAGERERLAALVVLTTRLRTGLKRLG